MTKDEAVEHIWYLTQQVAGEFCVERDEVEALNQETRDAPAALGA